MAPNRATHHKSEEKAAEILIPTIPPKLVRDSNPQRNVISILRYCKKNVLRNFLKISEKHMRWKSFDLTHTIMINELLRQKDTDQ